jgi:hypothetical protein
MASYTVLVTSAIFSNYGVYTPNERILQTIKTINLYEEIVYDMFGILFKQQKYIHAEHAMSKFLPKELLVEINSIGLKGNTALDGLSIVD